MALEARPAMLLSRVGSGLIDLAVGAVGGLVILVPGLALATNQAQSAAVMITAFVTAMVIIPTTVETITRGLSAGKVATGIRIVREDGGPVRFRQAFVRALTAVLEVWLTFGAVAVITSLVNARGKRLGDLLAGTYAVRARGSEAALAPLLMPPDLASWAEHADIRRLPSGPALHARIFLGRTGSLRPEVRDQAARSLAAMIEPYVSPPPPWGTHPERFLAAVLVARRNQEYQAASRRRETEHEEAERMRRLPYGVADYS
ncbi:RDD family protein [Ruania halotolerans]|uniref:RDD family protein n=1 Tax=Ruania halotolerans TaxID=2897773 RepID=UPI001E568C9A|nr:RDD family protein [Ruania halotolerans]UFU07580.1 RDD family protein [Ruania halotolerans]